MFLNSISFSIDNFELSFFPLITLQNVRVEELVERGVEDLGRGRENDRLLLIFLLDGDGTLADRPINPQYISKFGNNYQS